MSLELKVLLLRAMGSLHLVAFSNELKGYLSLVLLDGASVRCKAELVLWAASFSFWPRKMSVGVTIQRSMRIGGSKVDLHNVSIGEFGLDTFSMIGGSQIYVSLLTYFRVHIWCLLTLLFAGVRSKVVV